MGLAKNDTFAAAIAKITLLSGRPRDEQAVVRHVAPPPAGHGWTSHGVTRGILFDWPRDKQATAQHVSFIPAGRDVTCRVVACPSRGRPDEDPRVALRFVRPVAIRMRASFFQLRLMTLILLTPL